MMDLEKLCEYARIQEATNSGKKDYEEELKIKLEKYHFRQFEYFINDSGNEESKFAGQRKAPLFRPLPGCDRGYLFLAGLPGQGYSSEREGTFYLVLQEAEKTREFHKIIRHLTTDNLLDTKSTLGCFLGGAIIGGAALMGADLALLEESDSVQLAGDAALGAVLGAMGGLGTLVGKDYFRSKRDTARLMDVYRPLMKHSSMPYDADFLEKFVL